MRVGFGIWLLGFGISAALAAGCAKAQAKGAPDGPPLQMPSPPERVLAPVEEPVTAEAPAPEPPAPAAAAPPRTPPRTAPPARRPEPAPAAAEPAPPPAAPPPATPPRELRATSPATEKDVRDTLARVNADLNRVDYRRLNADARSQYDQSKRFTQQAQQALKDRNVVFAATLAEKAEALASQLLAR